MTTTITVTCDMTAGCTAPVTYVDSSGYVYCTVHGQQRQAYERCRKLRPAERARILAGEPLAKY